METEDRIRHIEEELRVLRERNVRVENDKAWETSMFRTIVITGLIYIVAALFLFSIQTPGFLLQALVPPLGFGLSVQTLPLIKRWWLRRR